MITQNNTAMYMNIRTGEVDTYEGWYYKNEAGETVNAVDLGEVVEVIKNSDGDWIEGSQNQKVSSMDNLTTQEIIAQLDNLDNHRQVVEFVQNADISAALTKNGLAVSYDSDAVDDSKAEIDAFESAAIWSFESFGSFVRVYDIAKAKEILDDSE